MAGDRLQALAHRAVERLEAPGKLLGGTLEAALQQLPVGAGVLGEGLERLGEQGAAQLFLAGGEGIRQLGEAQHGLLALGAELADEGQVQLLQGLAGRGLLRVQAVAQVVHLAGHQIDHPVAARRGDGLDFPQQGELLLGELPVQAPAKAAELEGEPDGYDEGCGEGGDEPGQQAGHGVGIHGPEYTGAPATARALSGQRRAAPGFLTPMEGRAGRRPAPGRLS